MVCISKQWWCTQYLWPWGSPWDCWWQLSWYILQQMVAALHSIQYFCCGHLSIRGWECVCFVKSLQCFKLRYCRYWIFRQYSLYLIYNNLIWFDLYNNHLGQQSLSVALLILTPHCGSLCFCFILAGFHQIFNIFCLFTINYHLCVPPCTWGQKRPCPQLTLALFCKHWLWPDTTHCRQSGQIFDLPLHCTLDLILLPSAKW